MPVRVCRAYGMHEPDEAEGQGFLVALVESFRAATILTLSTPPSTPPTYEDFQAFPNGAASVIAVTSLAIQLGDSVKKFSRFIRSIKNASKELGDLAKNLDRLERLLAEVAQVAEMQKSQGLAPQPSTTLITALEACRTEFQALEAYSSKVGASLQGRGVQKVRDSLRIPARKEKLQKLHNNLGKSIDQLGTVIVLNTTRIQ
ncbi:MAG: hypothetical protein Q9219_000728 [cf. Caloplaca sp. 3 TL-2023]